VRRVVAGALAFAVGGTGLAAAAAVPAAADTAYEVTGQWQAGTPDTAGRGDVVNALWQVNVNDDAPANDPVDNVTFTVTLEHGLFKELPDACQTTDVVPASVISDDDATLTCNLGTVQRGAEVVVQTPVIADGETGVEITAVGEIDGQQAPLTPIAVVVAEEETSEDASPSAPKPSESDPAEEPAPSDAPESAELPAQKSEESASAEDPKSAAPEAEGPITPLATNPTDTLIRVTQTFSAYVGAGENLDIAFEKVFDDADGVDAVITVRGPNGSEVDCTVADAEPAGSTCDWANLTGMPGVWEIDFVTGGGASADDQYAWDITVQTALSVDVPGRVWSDHYWMTQQGSGSSADIEFWYLSEQGFLYDVEYGDYHGIDSLFTANATGNALDGTCVSAYESYDLIGPFADPGFYTPTDECGPPYRIFFEEPDSSMPATATTPDGTTWLNPPLTLPNLENLDFAQDPVSDIREGEFTVDSTDFVGNASLQIDANNDGDYDDPEDRTIPFGVTADGNQTIPFDGIDGQGNPISLLDEIRARVLIDRVGEIHFTNFDVERRAGGISVEALTGPAAGTPDATTIYWNDTNLLTANRDCLTPEFDGMSGVDSSGGVHDWDCNPFASNANDGVNGSWGDQRWIDDWTFHQVELQDEMAIDEPHDFGDAPDSYGTTIGADGAYHGLYDGLTLGTELDAEPDGQPSGDATADGGDEDGVAGPVYVAVGVDSTIEVTATNETDDPATLAGWVDLDNSGTFEPGELVTVPVPANSGTAAYPLSFPGGATATGDAFARFRLYAGTPDQIGEILPTGPAASGEVEDYLVNLYSDEVVKEPLGVPFANADGTHTVEFGITVTREGTGPDYDLSDVFTVGDSITLNEVTSVNTDPGDITTLDNWDDASSTLEIVADEPIADGVTHEYLVTVNATIDAEAMSFDASDCSLTDGESGTGFLNTAELGTDGNVVEDDACVEATVPQIEKTVSSEPTPMGGGEYEVVYQIDVTNPHAGATAYDLDDVLMYGDAVTVVGTPTAEAITGGLSSLENEWDDATETLLIQSDEPIDAAADADSPTVHSYLVTVRFTVDLDQVTLENSDCTLTDGESGTGLLNSSSIEVDEQSSTDLACPSIPLIGVSKTVSDGPVANGDGTWTVTYDVVATNSGDADGVYTATDMMTADGDLVVESGTIVSAPDGVTVSEDWTGLGTEQSDAENVIAADVVLPAGGTHTYQVEVVVSVDDTGGVPIVSDCAELGEDGPGGLSNVAEVEHNELTDDAEACVMVAFITVDKTVSSGPTPNGDGTWTVLYDIVAENIGGSAGEYDLSDRLLFGEGVVVESADVVTTPDGVADPAGWTGQGADLTAAENQVATGVTLDAGGEHTYQVQVVVSLDRATVTPDTLTCPEPGSGDSGGLANSTELTHNGEVQDDDACATLPLIDITKEVVGDPVAGEDGAWTVTYEITAVNDGAAEGVYTLTDRLRFGAGITVDEATVTDTPEGVTALASWTGQGAVQAAPANVVADGVTLGAGRTHTYRVQVLATVNGSETNLSAFTCPEPGFGERGGFANVAGIDLNDLTDSADACATPLADTSPPGETSPPPLAPTGADVSWLIAGAALLLLLGAAAMIVARQRRSTD
jgi:hypothetical protein